MIRSFETAGDMARALRSRLDAWKQRVRHLQGETYALYLACRDPRVPWYAKGLIAFVVAHTFSPIDLIPDFIPILGVLDDLIITPLGIALALRMIPGEVMANNRETAQAIIGRNRPSGRLAAAAIVATWLLAVALIVAIIAQVMPLIPT